MRPGGPEGDERLSIPLHDHTIARAQSDIVFRVVINFIIAHFGTVLPAQDNDVDQFRVSGNAAQAIGSVEVLAYGTALVRPGR